MEHLTLSAKIEGLLFFKGEPLSEGDIAKMLGEEAEPVRAALEELSRDLAGRGLALVRKDGAAMLGTAPQMASLLEGMRKEELSKELTKSALETLAIILYKKDATRGDIDYIRGVNSSFILRNLQVRGLIEKAPHPADSRKSVYRPTFDLVSFMGLSSLDDLPEYAELRKEAGEIGENAVE